MGSASFDRIADRYDETRGGLERGGGLAREIAPHLRPGAVAEVGVGTAAVALPLARLRHPVVGFDLSAPMLGLARERLGARVARADGYHLPLPGGAVPNAVLVWLLQLVPGIAGLLAEARRVLSPGGRLVVVPAGGQVEDDDIARRGCARGSGRGRARRLGRHVTHQLRRAGGGVDVPWCRRAVIAGVGGRPNLPGGPRSMVVVARADHRPVCAGC